MTNAGSPAGHRAWSRAAGDFADRVPGGGRQSLPAELAIDFGACGHVALFGLENATTVILLAVRHPREQDYP
ncbi:hypothetical protein [Pseudoxanthomonas japonensis]|uniref:hypothetical protein n=1 Tax=Pseudoxanthomonas japonensis TaxID=69284 RepID=UPI000DB291C4|nr:hypothetical protein [Pseudoxanthomonas japonensis]PZQ31938.1 MAG: hypothetical protein DI562_04575 [Stenotrophomonas acidaminiphila]